MDAKYPIRLITKWSPAVLLVLLLGIGVITGANAKDEILLLLAILQLVWLVLWHVGPWAARKAGEFIGNRQASSSE